MRSKDFRRLSKWPCSPVIKKTGKVFKNPKCGSNLLCCFEEASLPFLGVRKNWYPPCNVIGVQAFVTFCLHSDSFAGDARSSSSDNMWRNRPLAVFRSMQMKSAVVVITRLQIEECANERMKVHLFFFRSQVRGEKECALHRKADSSIFICYPESSSWSANTPQQPHCF